MLRYPCAGLNHAAVLRAEWHHVLQLERVSTVFVRITTCGLTTPAGEIDRAGLVDFRAEEIKSI